MRWGEPVVVDAGAWVSLRIHWVDVSVECAGGEEWVISSMAVMQGPDRPIALRVELWRLAPVSLHAAWLQSVAADASAADVAQQVRTRGELVRDHVVAVP